jgi:hypothetical protein
MYLILYTFIGCMLVDIFLCSSILNDDLIYLVIREVTLHSLNIRRHIFLYVWNISNIA